MTRLGWFLLTALLTTALVSVGWIWREPLLRRVLRSVYVVTDDTTAEEAKVMLERLAAWDAAGIPVLVEALNASQPEVRQTAHRFLLDRSALWRWPTTVDSAHQLQTLAESLATRVEKFQPPARLIAAQLAGRILRWPVDERYVNRARILAACERVLTAGQTPPTMEAVSEYVPPSPITVAVRSTSDRPAEEPPLPGQSLAQRIQRQAWPRGPAAAHSDFVPPPKGNAQEQAQAKIVLDGSMVVVPEEASRVKPAAVGEPAPRVATTSKVERAVAQTPIAPASDKPANAPAKVQRDEMVVPSAAEEPSPAKPEPADDVDAYDVLLWLHSPDPTIRQRAREELTGRGFKDREFAMAERLLHSDARVRREFVRSLPGLAIADPAVWLLWAARDNQAEVRLDALTLLATTREPRIMEQVRQLAAKDSDYRVRRLADQIKTP